MLNIFMLDDNLQELHFFDCLVIRTLFTYQVDASVKLATQKANELVRIINSESLENTLFFLDYDLQCAQTSGLEIAKMIRARSATAEIVFISGHKEAVLDLVTGEIKPMNFISKGIDAVALDAQIRNDILKCVKQVTMRQNNSMVNFTANQDGDLVVIPLDEIIYIQSAKTTPGILKVYAQCTTLAYRGSLSDVEEKYPSLIRCHKSFIINPRAVRKFQPSRRIVTMSNGAEIEVGLRKLSIVRKKIMETGKSDIKVN